MKYPSDVLHPANAEAAQRIGYGPIHLYRKGSDVVVSILQSDGVEVDVIRTHHDGNFDETVYPIEMESIQTGVRD